MFISGEFCEESVFRKWKNCVLLEVFSLQRRKNSTSQLKRSAILSQSQCNSDPPRCLFLPRKKNVPRHILAPRRGCFSNHLPLRRVCIPAERFLSYRNEVSYTIKKFPIDMNLFHPHLSGILFLTQLIYAAHICYFQQCLSASADNSDQPF